MPFQIDIVDLADYVGQSADDAETAIVAQGLTVRRAYDYDDVVAAGVVLAQDVAAVGEEHVVILTVSLGWGASLNPMHIAAIRTRAATRRTLRIRYTP